MIEVKNIRKSFQGREVLKGIDTTFMPGQTNLIIGQSGSGKTVMLKSIVGIHDVDSGSILFNGLEVSKMKFNERQKLRQEIGMVFQGGALFDSITVADNIRFPMDMFTKLSRKEKQIQVDRCIEMVELKDAHDLFPSEISGGMQKRVAIARAISLGPKYLFCDEPNSGLDPMTSIVIDKLIQRITYDLKITTVINTHDMNSVMEIGEKILFLHQGEKCWEGNSSEILNVDNEELNRFVFASDILKKVKEVESRG
ncbi:ATP-binding cassette domain-containing protein [Halosquirtibacter laminarini]|uniref:ATP-binding cassette domain-containing protein n=1 Tax=Halosquirtibacter laminarini TaxID=3374600 RepID=A0AC61NF12_9BACT|nr:ATP-binding cassette domain-containing protein [Prolixibacteraceae bacterium]